MKHSLVFIDQYAGLAGAERILLAVATAPSIRAEWNVTFALPETGWLAEKLYADRVPVMFFPGLKLHYGRKTVGDLFRFVWDFPRQVVWFRRFFRDTKADLVYMSSPRFVLQAVCAAIGQRTRVVYHVQCIYSGFVKGLLRVTFGSSKLAHIVANSRASERWVRSLAPDRHVTHIPNWTPLPPAGSSQGEPGGRPMESCRADSFRFAVIGRVVSIKGQDLFLRAARRLLNAGEVAEFYVVGSGGYFEPDYETRLRSEFGAAREIHFVGHVDDIDSVYAQVSCVVVPSREEAFGLVAIEAMAHGVPVIVSNVGELPEIVGNGKSGLVFRSGDVDDLVSAMTRLMHDRVLASRLSAGGRETVVAQYSPSESIARIEALLRILRDPEDSGLPILSPRAVGEKRRVTGNS